MTPGDGRVAIVVAGTLWSATAILSWATARQRRFAAHRRWIVYSVAIMWGYGVGVFVVINALYYVAQLDVTTAAEAARWTSWTGSLLIAHWWLERSAGRTFVGVSRRPAELKTETR